MWIVYPFSFVVLLTIMSCTTRPTELDLYREFHQGKQGLTTTLVGVPLELLEQTPFTFSVKIDNLGAYGADGLTVLSMEEDYLCLYDSATQRCVPEDYKERQKVRSFVLNGRSRYSPRGESAMVEYPLKTKNIDALSEQHTSHITATTCYAYTTEFIGEACLDPWKYTLKKSKPVCDMKTIKATDQGAPIAITNVAVDLMPDGGVVKPLFTFTVENKGKGITIYPATKINELCSSSQLSFREANAIALQELKLSNGLFYIYGRDDINTMVCEQNPLILKEGTAQIRCYQKSQRAYDQFTIENTRPAFTVQLSATFAYGYMENTGQNLVIRKAVIR